MHTFSLTRDPPEKADTTDISINALNQDSQDLLHEIITFDTHETFTFYGINIPCQKFQFPSTESC